jgi:hypothetical protein
VGKGTHEEQAEQERKRVEEATAEAARIMAEEALKDR